MATSKKKYTHYAKDGAPIQLTKQQKDYADLKIAQPNTSLREIARQAYPNASDSTLGQIAHHNERNANIIIYNNEQVEQAKRTVYEIANSPDSKDRDRLTASFDILDRQLGKATQKIEQTTTGISFSIDLTQAYKDIAEVEQ